MEGGVQELSVRRFMLKMRLPFAKSDGIGSANWGYQVSQLGVSGQSVVAVSPDVRTI